MSTNLQQEEIQQLQSFSSPWKLVKKAFSSIFLLLIIGSGFVVNWVLGLIYAFSWFQGTSWLWYLLGLALWLIVFPAAYIFCAYMYGQSLLFWEAYREIIRPMTAKIFSGVLDKSLKEDGTESSTEESTIVKELEERSKHFLEKLPDFIRAYFQVFITGKDVVKLIKEQRKAGADKEAVKSKAMQSMFEALDLQMSELMEPSMIPFYIVGAINLVAIYFLMF